VLPMVPVAEAYLRARLCQQAGDFAHAELLARQVVQQEPAHAEAWVLLGAACHGQGKHAEAAAHFQQALRLRPSADAHYGLAGALAALGRHAEAVDHYRHALRLEPRHAEALTDLGVALAEQGALDEATALLRQAAALRPGFAKASYNLGVALAQQGRLDDAAASLRQALASLPGYAAAHYALGNVLRSQGRRDESIAAYREAVQLRPDYGEAYNNLGLALTEAGRSAEAAILLEQAVHLRPKDGGAHNNLGLAYADLGRYDEAEACYREALRLDPNDADAHSNRGNALKEQGRLEEALACYQLALWLKPESVSAHWNRALAWLQAGDYERGWPEYEWRWRRPQTPLRPFAQHRWDGGPLAGRTILLWCEQGLGDSIQFIRYAPLVKEKGGAVVVECPAQLVPLFRTCAGIDRLVVEGEPLPAFDVQAPLMSLPGLLGTTLGTVLAAVPYLAANPALVGRWRQELAGVGGFRVGICWQGNPRHPWDRHRSIPLEVFAPLAAVAGVRLLSLQQGAGAEQLRALAGRFPVVELPPSLDGTAGDFADTAAVMQCLDLVVSADTAAAHLAGALGVPVWVALSAIADWRWLVGREDSPWYPTLRLFRQERLGEWGPAFARTAEEVRVRAARGAAAEKCAKDS
jgi:tetratricopeptide (TPR) repeat protein